MLKYIIKFLKKRMLKYNPCERITAKSALSHVLNNYF